jgi:hypothetical protein
MNPSAHLAAAMIVLVGSTTAMSASPASRTGSFHLDAAPRRAFALFTAQGERLWAPGWEPEMLSGESSAAAFSAHTAMARPWCGS